MPPPGRKAKMKYYEVIRKHDYIDEILRLTIECNNEKEAREILENNGYTIIYIDDDLERIYVK